MNLPVRLASVSLSQSCCERSSGCGCDVDSASSSGSAASRVTLLNVSYDPTREFYQEFNASFAAYWKQQTGQAGDDRAVARRLGQAGPRGDRRPGSRRRHAGPGLRHRCDRRQGEAAAGGLAKPPAAQQQPLHLDDRVPRPQGQPQGDQGLGRPGQGRRADHHAQSQDERRGSLELPGRLGLLR